MDDKNGLPGGRELIGQANLEQQIAIWTVFWNPLCFWGTFYRPRRRGDFFSQKNGRVLFGMCHLAGVG